MVVGPTKSWIQIQKTIFESMNQTYSKRVGQHFYPKLKYASSDTQIYKK
jgi:hypothetical protein